MKKILKDSIFFSSILFNLMCSASLCVAWFKQVDIRNMGVTIALIILAITSIITLAIILSGKE